MWLSAQQILYLVVLIYFDIWKDLPSQFYIESGSLKLANLQSCPIWHFKSEYRLPPLTCHICVPFYASTVDTQTKHLDEEWNIGSTADTIKKYVFLHSFMQGQHTQLVVVVR